jgi:uncharacterized protein YndB with AHSA1/START domain
VTDNFVASSAISVDAPRERVWAVITDPDAAKEYMFGTELVTDWTVGGPIVWRGVWEGKQYEDHGTVLDFVPGSRLVCTHFSPLTGQPDLPENYHTLVWTLEGDDDTTQLTLDQDNNATADDAAHSKSMWDGVVASVKTIAER